VKKTNAVVKEIMPVKGKDAILKYDVISKIHTDALQPGTPDKRERIERRKPLPPRKEIPEEPLITMIALRRPVSSILKGGIGGGPRLTFEANLKEDLSAVLNEPVTRIKIRLVMLSRDETCLLVYLCFNPATLNSMKPDGRDPLNNDEILSLLQNQVLHKKDRIMSGEVTRDVERSYAPERMDDFDLIGLEDVEGTYVEPEGGFEIEEQEEEEEIDPEVNMMSHTKLKP